jgi:hypothetical protein
MHNAALSKDVSKAQARTPDESSCKVPSAELKNQDRLGEAENHPQTLVPIYDNALGGTLHTKRQAP